MLDPQKTKVNNELVQHYKGLMQKLKMTSYTCQYLFYNQSLLVLFTMLLFQDILDAVCLLILSRHQKDHQDLYWRQV